MKTFLIIVLLFISAISFAQNKFAVDYFSNNYYGIVNMTNSNGVENQGWIAIYDKNTNEELVKVESDGIDLDVNDEKAIKNDNVLPYKEQILIIYEDFNFDGVKDFAIEDGHHSCYGLPSYKIYLAENNNFVLDDKFTELSQNYCGMFAVVNEKKMLRAELKSGCCYHVYSEFIIDDGAPKLTSKITEDATQGDEYVYITTEKLIDGKWITTNSKEKIKDYYKDE